MIGKKSQIHPQMCIVRNGAITLTNDDKEPIKVGNAKMYVKEMRSKEIDERSKPYKIMAIPMKEAVKDNMDKITANKEKLNNNQKDILQQILNKNASVFNQDLQEGYNQASGPHYCKLKFANDERPSSRKVSCVQYNSQMNGLLQQVCDELTEANVLGIPQHENVEVNHVMPIFLRKKQKAKDKVNNELTTQDVRLVVNTCELSKYMRSLPAKISKPQDVYNALAKWKYIIKTDL